VRAHPRGLIIGRSRRTVEHQRGAQNGEGRRRSPGPASPARRHWHRGARPPPGQLAAGPRLWPPSGSSCRACLRLGTTSGRLRSQVDPGVFSQPAAAARSQPGADVASSPAPVTPQQPAHQPVGLNWRSRKGPTLGAGCSVRSCHGPDAAALAAEVPSGNQGLEPARPARAGLVVGQGLKPSAEPSGSQSQPGAGVPSS